MAKAAQQLKGKPNPLAAVLRQTPTKPSVVEKPEPEPKPARPKKPKKTPKPSRANTHLIGGHFPEAWQRQLAIIAAEEGTTRQELLAEALNDLFVKRGKKRLGL